MKTLDYFKPIDLLFERLFTPSSLSEEASLFLKFLVKQTRDGHLSVDLTQNLSQFYSQDIGLTRQEFLRKIQEGACEWQNLLQENSSFPVVIKNSRAYIKKVYELEESLIASIFRLLKREFCPFPKEKTDELLKTSNLLLSQKEAVKSALSSSICLITGGPGTGKTYTAGYLLEIFSQLFSSYGYLPKIALTAPTGKAAMRLEESLSSIKLQAEIETKTLHQLLNIRYSFTQESPKLFYDLILVDEASMVDLRLFEKLLCSLSDKTRLVMLGDPNQLPPVEIGTIFSELTKLKRPIGVAKLDQCVRAENRELIEVANQILEGLFKVGPEVELQYVKTFEVGTKQAKKLSIDSVVQNNLQLSKFLALDMNNPAQLFEHFRQRKILTASHHGLYGSKMLNEKCLELVLEARATQSFVALPIIITKNDYELELFNGTEGVYIKHLDEDCQEKDFVYFERGTSHICWPVGSLNAFELCFALTIHKSQGSEYRHVTICLDQQAERFGKELIYTAITRAKQTVDMYVAGYSFKRAYLQKQDKMTGLSALLEFS